MNRISNDSISSRSLYPERIIQFGGGNFLRGFFDWMVDIMNEKVGFSSDVVVVKPTPRGKYTDLDEQNGLFHVLVRGIENGSLVQHTRLIQCVRRTVQPYLDFPAYLKLAEAEEMRFIVSNTTEAGISFDEANQFGDQPALSFPGKLTQLLFHRYQHFEGAPDKGFIILPCELIEQNGQKLKTCVQQYTELWQLEEGFSTWVETANIFCNTLVDRIVTGYPKSDATEIQDQIGYEDKLLVAAEPYYIWVIEDPHRVVAKEFPTLQARLNVQFVDNLTKHRTLKVRILNGAHTAMVPVGYLNGLRTVRESVENESVGSFIRDLIYTEILPTLDYSEADKVSYAQAVMDRFKNPFIEHFLADIALNSISKFKTRLLPSLSWYLNEEGDEQTPELILKALAALITFYKGEWKGDATPLRDNPDLIQFFQSAWQNSPTPESLAQAVLKGQLNGTVSFPETFEKRLAEILEGETFIF